MLARIIFGGAAAAAALILSGCRRQEHPELRREAPPQNPLNPDLRLPSSKFSPPSTRSTLSTEGQGEALQSRAALFKPNGTTIVYAFSLSQEPTASIVPPDSSPSDSPLPAASAAASLYQNKEYREAIKAAREELSSAPQNSTLYFILGASQGQEENFQAAEQSLKTAVQLNPNNARTHFALGSCYLKMHQPEAGLLHLKKAEILNPGLKPLIAQLLEGEEIPSNARRATPAEPAYETRFD